MIDIEYIKNNIKTGFKLNPNEKIVNGIINGLNRNNGECPCVNDSTDCNCPCSNYREKDKCCCTLYVKDNE
jgi:ferredoxin-thioredoxin reductase catalytic subunit